MVKERNGARVRNARDKARAVRRMRRRRKRKWMKIKQRMGMRMRMMRRMMMKMIAMETGNSKRRERRENACAESRVAPKITTRAKRVEERT